MYARDVYSGINVKSSICDFLSALSESVFILYLKKKGLVKQNLLNGLKTEEE